MTNESRCFDEQHDSRTPQRAARRTALRRELGLVAWQIRYEQRAFWRNRERV